jgi:hypothetical protein
MAFASVLAALAAVALFVPLQPVLPAAGLDPSWKFAMNQAVAQHLSFGDQLVFSFGPWASIYTQTYHPATDRMMLLGGVYVAASCWLAFMVLIDRRSWPWMVLLAAVLLPLRASRDAALFLPPLLAMLASLRITGAWRTDQKPVTWLTLAAVALLFAPTGVLPLVKGTALILSAGIVACGAGWYIADRKPLLAATVLIAPVVAGVVFWLAAGQTPAALLLYLGRMLALSSAYVDAMSVDGRVAEIEYFLAGAIAVVVTAAMNKAVSGRARLCLAVVYGILLFVAFKAAFVRHDAGHAMIAGSTLLFAALTLPFSARPVAALPAIVLSFAVWAAIESNYSEGWRHSLTAGTRTLVASFTARLTREPDLHHEYAAALESIAAQQPLPLMPGSTDIYPFDQAFLFASHNTWSPRPVFQSYAALTPALAEANREHLVDSDAPENVVFKVSPIDGRVPSSEDGPSWPALLRFYRPTTRDGDFLFLKRRSNERAREASVGPSISSAHALGERILLPASRHAVFARLRIRPTLFGTAIGFLFKRSQLGIRFELRDGSQRTFRLVPGLAESGFLLSPLIETTPEFGLLYGRLSMLRNKEVTAFIVTPAGSVEEWSSRYELVLTEMMTSDVDEISNVIAFPQFDDQVPGYQISDAQHCDGFIDLVNSVVPGNESRSSGLLQASGWITSSLEQGRTAEAVYAVLTDEQHRRRFAKATTVSRPDVSAHFNRPGLERSGFSLNADISTLRGRYSLGIAIKEGSRLQVCPQPATVIEILPP